MLESNDFEMITNLLSWSFFFVICMVRLKNPMPNIFQEKADQQTTFPWVGQHSHQETIRPVWDVRR